MILLEADGITDPDVWFWEQAEPSPCALVDSVVAIEVEVPDPVAMGRLWHELLGRTPAGDPRVVRLGTARLRFVTGDNSSHWRILLGRSGSETPRGDLIPGGDVRL